MVSEEELRMHEVLKMVDKAIIGRVCKNESTMFFNFGTKEDQLSLGQYSYFKIHVEVSNPYL